MSALFSLLLTLTIPDICSKVEFDAKEELGERYQKWFDKNISPNLIGEHGRNGKQFDCVNGYFVYQLRCKMIHGDAIDIETIVNKPESSFINRHKYEKVIFRLSNKEYSEMFVIQNNHKQKFAIIFHSVPQLIKHILIEADSLYKKTNDKTLFYDGCFVQIMPEYVLYDLHSELLGGLQDGKN